MRYVYLIRHAAVALPDTKKRCISRTEFPLSHRGTVQAKELGAWAKVHNIEAVYSSPAERCRETAELMFGNSLPVHIVDSLNEVDVGEWEGLTFDEIRAQWPTVYDARGKRMSEVAPPGGESFFRAASRFNDVLRDVISEHEDNVAVITHAGMIRSWLFRYAKLGDGNMFSIPVPYAGIVTLCMEGGKLLNATVGIRACQVPGDDEIADYYRRCNTPEAVIVHCRAVADKARQLVSENNIPCNEELLHTACLLHDMCRTDGKTHPLNAAHILTMDGYPALAASIAHHHDLPPHPSTETEILYLSDKLVSGTDTVSLDERFSRSYKKCADDVARQSWERRRSEAMRIVKKYHLDNFV